jgi:hypothetical protein
MQSVIRDLRGHPPGTHAQRAPGVGGLEGRSPSKKVLFFWLIASDTQRVPGRSR